MEDRMKRLIVGVVFALPMLLSPMFALAQDATHNAGGVGFHNVEAPLGVRWWFAGQKVGIDLGVGFTNSPSGIDPDEKVNGFALDVGVPFVAHSWERAHVLLRPGILYQSQEVGFDSDPGTPGVQFDTETQSQFVVSGEIEGEVFLVDNISVSASTGIAFVSFDPGFGADSESSFGTFGNNFTNVGFHLYFFGGGQ
jgi:hypothetical protein